MIDLLQEINFCSHPLPGLLLEGPLRRILKSSTDIPDSNHHRLGSSAKLPIIEQDGIHAGGLRPARRSCRVQTLEAKSAEREVIHICDDSTGELSDVLPVQSRMDVIMS